MDFARDRDKLSQHEPVTATEQLAALARLDGVLAKHGIPYWLFGGWAVDFHAGSVTRSHDDLDIAVWSKDLGLPRFDGQGWWLGQATCVRTSLRVVVSNSSGVM
jgi:hypothetical protein